MKRFLVLLILVLSIFTLVACSSDEAPADNNDTDTAVESATDMQAIYDSYTSYLPEMILLDDNSMLNLYGVDTSKCKQAIIANCSDGLRSDEVWLIEANDEAYAKEVATLAQNRIDREAQETQNYAPDQYAVVQNAKIIEDGCNVVMIISPDVDTLADLYNSAK